MLLIPPFYTSRIGKALPNNITDKEFLELEIKRWKYSPERRMQIDGERYYMGDHDILKRTRTVIGEGGELQEVRNLPNNHIVDNQFAKLVDQKVNYLLSKPITFECGNEADTTALNDVLDEDFLTKLKNGGTDALWGGLFWLYVYYDENGQLAFQRFKPYEILPFWKDSEHTDLDCAVRLYTVEGYEGVYPRVYEKVEVFTHEGILRYDLEEGRLIEDIDRPHGYYAYVGEKGFNWERIPLVAFKYNAREIPLIKRCKSLQDALNAMRSDLINNMQEDNRNTVLIIKNYDGQDLGEFRRNLSTYGAVKVRAGDGADGGVEALSVQVNAQNYELVLNTLKKALIENAMGYDAKDDRIGSNANQINIRSMYSDIDLDADSMESEFKAALKQLMFFINAYLGKELDPQITFNRDTMINETEVIDNLVKLGVRLPNELLVAQVPFVDNVQDALDMLDKEQAEQDLYAQAFAQPDSLGGNKSNEQA